MQLRSTVALICEAQTSAYQFNSLNMCCVLCACVLHACAILRRAGRCTGAHAAAEDASDMVVEGPQQGRSLCL